MRSSTADDAGVGGVDLLDEEELLHLLVGIDAVPALERGERLLPRGGEAEFGFGRQAVARGERLELGGETGERGTGPGKGALAGGRRAEVVAASEVRAARRRPRARGGGAEAGPEAPEVAAAGRVGESVDREAGGETLLVQRDRRHRAIREEAGGAGARLGSAAGSWKRVTISRARPSARAWAVTARSSRTAKAAARLPAGERGERA
jgi:hypothetical protein